MEGISKRKGQWSSVTFFGLRSSHKKPALEKITQGLGDAAVDTHEPDDRASTAVSSTSQTSSRASSAAEKLRRRGSRLLSIIRLRRSTQENDSFGKLSLRLLIHFPLLMRYRRHSKFLLWFPFPHTDWKIWRCKSLKNQRHGEK